MSEKTELKVEDIRKDAEGKGCNVLKAFYYIGEFLEGPMCGKCFPCSMGSYEAKIRLRRLTSGRGTEADIAALKRIAGEMLEASMCKKGKDTAKFILEWMEKGEYEEHIKGRCPAKVCTSLIEYRVLPEECILCNLCKEACHYNAITGEKKVPYKSGYFPYEIRQRRCVKCGDCIKVCHVGAIEIADAASPVKAGV
jgi:ferredoxin